MNAQAKAPNTPSHPWLRSTGAVFLGFFSAAVLTLATDQWMIAVKVLRTSGQPIAEAPFVLAMVYRLIYNVAGCYLAARLAPYRPMRHALVIGWLGLVLTAVTTVTTWSTVYGPHWYALANVLLALPSAWLGGNLHHAWHVEFPRMNTKSRIAVVVLAVVMVAPRSSAGTQITGTASGVPSAKENAMKKKAQGHYASVNGLSIYYEVHGTGEPLILLHGGVAGLEMFGPNLLALAKARHVIAVDLQGHGRTADIGRPLRFESMADDIAALMTQLRLKKADVMGYSLGGGVALQLAIRHQEVVRKLVLVSTPFSRAGFYPEVLKNFDQMGPETAKFMTQSPLYQMYPGVDWPKLFTKLGDLQRLDYDWSRQVSAIRTPVLIVFADADAFRPAHIVEFFQLLGGGKSDAGLDGSARPMNELAIIPGLTHYNIMSSPRLVEAVTPFLDASVPGAK